jgi:hypothetical protein
LLLKKRERYSYCRTLVYEILVTEGCMLDTVIDENTNDLQDDASHKCRPSLVLAGSTLGFFTT